MAGRLRWVASGVMMLGAGVLTVLSAHRHWAACSPDTTTAGCHALEEATLALPVWAGAGHRDPVAAVLTIVAGLLLTLSWASVIGWPRRRLLRTILAAVITLQPLGGAVLGVLDLVRPDSVIGLARSGWLTWPAEMLVLPFLLGAGWIIEEGPARMTRLIVLAWGVTSFGSMHAFGDYVVFRMRNPIPPGVPAGAAGNPAGMGYLAAFTQLAVGLSVVVLSLWLERRPHEGDGDGDRRDQGGFTLAA